MSRLDTDAADRDVAADRLRERDHEREPRLHRHPRCVSPVARQAFQASVIDSVNEAHEVTMQLRCASCSGSIYVPRDSDLEDIDCAGCSATYTTRRTIDGVDLLPRDPGAGT